MRTHYDKQRQCSAKNSAVECRKRRRSDETVKLDDVLYERNSKEPAELVYFSPRVSEKSTIRGNKLFRDKFHNYVSSFAAPFASLYVSMHGYQSQ
jgi:hypothetical protein